MDNMERWLPLRLQELIIEKHITAYELAKRSDVSAATISRILSGKALPSIMVLHRLCEGLEITEVEFFTKKKSQQQVEFDRRFLRAVHTLPPEHQKHHLAYLEYTAHIYNSTY